MLRAAPALLLAVACRVADAPSLLTLALAALAAAAALEPGSAGRAPEDPGAGELALAIVARLLLAAFALEMAGWRHVGADPLRVGVLALWLGVGGWLAWRQKPSGPLAVLRPLLLASYAAAALLALTLPDPLFASQAPAVLALGLATTLRGGREGESGLRRTAAARALHAYAVTFLALPLLGLGR